LSSRLTPEALAPVEELRRLREGPPEGLPPTETDVLEHDCPRGADRALEQVREVLAAVLVHAQGEWPGLEAWKRQLPAWFVAACVDAAEVRDCVLDRWSLRAWIYWFQPELRKWRWWDGRPEADRLRVTILVLERPYLRGALEWLLKAAALSPR
jgi:hypothetical protein